LKRVLASLGSRGWTLAALATSVVVAGPLLAVTASVFLDSEGEWSHLVETRLFELASNTVLLALGVVTISLIVGVACGWLTSACRFPGRGLLRVALLLPLAVPGYLSAYAYTDLLQFSGPVQSAIRESTGWGRRDYWFPEIRSLSGAIAILSLSLYPYVYLAARTAFADATAAATEASRTLGRGPWTSFASVALPMARPAIAAGAALVLMETLADFGAVDYFAVDTFATGVYRAWIGADSIVVAGQLSTCLLGLVAIAVVMEKLSRRRARHHSATQRQSPATPYRLQGFGAVMAFVVCVLPVLLGFGIPAGLFLQMTLSEGDARSTELFLDHGWNTLVVALAAAGIAAGLALLLAFARRLRPTMATRIGVRVAGLGYAIPGTVVAVGLLVPLAWLDHRLNGLTLYLFDWRPGLVLTGSVAALLIGYQTRFLAVSLALVDAGLGRVRSTLDDAARSLGVGRWGLLVRVHVPLLRGSVLAAMLLVFVDVAKELPVTLILRPFDFDTLAVRVYQLASDERLEEASTGALAIIAVGLLPAIILSKLMDRPTVVKP
jgi:iron(III) transport system permease protein